LSPNFGAVLPAARRPRIHRHGDGVHCRRQAM